MKIHSIAIAVAATLALGTNSIEAASLLAPGAQDLTPTHLSTSAQPRAAALDHAPVRTSHALDPQQALKAAPSPYVDHSRAFLADASETQMRAGLALTTSASGAVIRLSPKDGAKAMLDPAGVMLRANGKTMRLSDSKAPRAQFQELREAGMDVAEGTLAFRVPDELGSGELRVIAPHAQGRYLVHVFEPRSDVVMDLSADRATVLAGNTITFRAWVEAGTLGLTSGLVTAPDGYSADLHFVRNSDGSFSASFTPDAAHRDSPALWEAHAFTAVQQGNRVIRRDATTAFAVNTPTARFDSSIALHEDGSGVHVDLGLEIGSASRYQVSGVLYATDADGVSHPAALAQSAAWMATGKGKIGLDFDAAALSQYGLHAPYTLHDLRLIDQADMGLLERRLDAARFDN
jgi:hypothetical protein